MRYGLSKVVDADVENLKLDSGRLGCLYFRVPVARSVHEFRDVTVVLSISHCGLVPVRLPFIRIRIWQHASISR
jgi:hypothetical protein